MKGGLLLACVLVALVLAGCGGGGKHAYPANVQANFLNSCEANGGDVSSCGCALNWFESHKSLTQFMADEDQVNSGAIPSDVTQAMGSCSNS